MFKNIAVVLLSVCLMHFNFSRDKLIFSGIDGVYSFYTQSSVSSDFVSVDSEVALKVKKGIKNICGESIKFKINQFVIEKVISTYKAKALIKECGESFYTEYYYTEKIPFYELIGGVKVNIQVAYSGDYAIIGSPIIYGAF